MNNSHLSQEEDDKPDDKVVAAEEEESKHPGQPLDEIYRYDETMDYAEGARAKAEAAICEVYEKGDNKLAIVGMQI